MVSIRAGWSLRPEEALELLARVAWANSYFFFFLPWSYDQSGVDNVNN